MALSLDRKLAIWAWARTTAVARNARYKWALRGHRNISYAQHCDFIVAPEWQLIFEEAAMRTLNEL